MEVVTLTCWDDFEPELRELEQVEAPAEERDATSPAVCLFRGHGDARWSLDTTLDRFFPGKLSLAEYYQLALVARPRLEAFTGMRWQIPSYDEYQEWLLGGDGMTLRDYKAYDYLAYLRHHGFPSPLLDWTQSPYVAAFFAFRYLMPGAAHVASMLTGSRPLNRYRRAPKAQSSIDKARMSPPTGGTSCSKASTPSAPQWMTMASSITLATRESSSVTRADPIRCAST